MDHFNEKIYLTLYLLDCVLISLSLQYVFGDNDFLCWETLSLLEVQPHSHVILSLLLAFD